MIIIKILILVTTDILKWRTTFSAEKVIGNQTVNVLNFKSKGCWAWAEANGNLKIRKLYTYIIIIKCCNSFVFSGTAIVATVSLCFMLTISFYANVDNRNIKPTLLMQKPKQDFLRYKT